MSTIRPIARKRPAPAARNLHKTKHSEPRHRAIHAQQLLHAAVLRAVQQSIAPALLLQLAPIARAGALVRHLKPLPIIAQLSHVRPALQMQRLGAQLCPANVAASQKHVLWQQVGHHKLTP